MKLFDDVEPRKNRRLTSREQQEEFEDAKIWQRFPRFYLYDRPFYPWVTTDNTKTVNFDLNPPEYGI